MIIAWCHFRVFSFLSTWKRKAGILKFPRLELNVFEKHQDQDSKPNRNNKVTGGFERNIEKQKIQRESNEWPGILQSSRYRFPAFE